MTSDDPRRRAEGERAESGLGTLGLRNEDLAEQLVDHEGSVLWLGRYPAAAVRGMLDSHGIVEALARRGALDPSVVIEPLDAFRQALKVFRSRDACEEPMIELRTHEGPLEPLGAAVGNLRGDRFTRPRVLVVDWLLLQDPGARFRADRMPFPEQRHPGLGMAHPVMKFLLDVARRHRLAAIVNHPQHYHNAWIYGAGFRFLDPAIEGRMDALERDLGDLSPSERSWAIDLGCVYAEGDDRPFEWTPDVQVYPLDDALSRRVRGRRYAAARRAAVRGQRFELDVERFRDALARLGRPIRDTILRSPRRASTAADGRQETEPMERDASLVHMVRRIAAANPSAIAYRSKVEGVWRGLSWAEYLAACERTARALMAHGVERGDRVAILSQTRLEWVQCDLAILSAGAATVGIYPSSLADECAYVVNHCGARVLFVENREQLQKVDSVRAHMPDLETIVLLEGDVPGREDVHTWSAFHDAADSIDPPRLERRIDALDDDAVASLVYTSGTTGVPKGAVLTHGNFVFTSESASRCLSLHPGQTTLLFLPLAHVFARLAVYFLARNVVTVAFAEDIAKVGDNLREVRPHFIASVPRIFEKVYDKIVTGVQSGSSLKRRIFEWAVDTGKEVSRSKQAGKPVPGMLRARYAIAEKLVFGKIQAAMGGRMSWAISGAAPLDRDLAEFFHACGLLILEGYGMTENASFTNVNRLDEYRFGTVGQVGPGIEMRCAEDGEILFRGPNVMKGYYRNEEATAETIDAEGWLHTGDIGEIDDDGFLRITDRKKDIIITAGGKNVAPQRIERLLKGSTYVSQAMAFGDRRKYLTAIVTLDVEQVEAWMISQGHAVADRSKLHEDPHVRELVDGEVDRMNRGLASFETIKKVRIAPDEFTIEGGELTPTMKLKRRAVVDKYRALLDSMYDV